MMRTINVTTLAAALATLMLGACRGDRVALGAPVPEGVRAVARLRDAAGADLGRATASEVGGGLRVTVDARALPPGLHGAHLHMVGACDAPAFTTAGDRWKPAGQHEDGLPNLLIGADGRGTLGVVIPGATMADLLDADGAALIVQAGPDDPMSGSAATGGGRIACGVFTRL